MATATTTRALVYDKLRTHVQSCEECRLFLRRALEAHDAGRGFWLTLCDEGEALADALLGPS